jgi:hypothetical protein
MLPSLVIDDRPSDEHVAPGTHTPPWQVLPVEQSSLLAHEVRHALPLASHANGAHDLVLGARQVPAPSQNAASVAVPAAQLAGVHSTLGPEAKPTQDVVSFAPSHVMALQVSPPPSAHATREPWGFPLTGKQRPTRPAISHASH